MRIKSMAGQSPGRNPKTNHFFSFPFLFFLWVAFVLISPALGIHIHHETGESGKKILIHSYFTSSHDASHKGDQPVRSRPESLPEHINSTGLAENLGNWDFSYLSLAISGFLFWHGLSLLSFFYPSFLLYENFSFFRIGIPDGIWVLLLVFWIGFRKQSLPGWVCFLYSLADSGRKTKVLCPSWNSANQRKNGYFRNLLPHEHLKTNQPFIFVLPPPSAS